jgi:simple sugar transport system substrate-binding protein
LTATTHHWGEFYTKTVKEVQAGNWKPESLWGGYADHMISLAPMSEAIPAEVQARIVKMEAQMANGSMHAFAGPVIDQDGNTVVAAGENMTDDQLVSMDFYVQGVVSKLPKK